MSTAKPNNGPALTKVSSDGRTCCLASHLDRARELLWLKRSGPHRSAAESWREEVMCNTRYSEPSLDELFWDTTMQLLLRRDGVTEGEVRALLGDVKQAQKSSGDIASAAGASISADWALDREDSRVHSRLTEPLEARTFPLRFI